MIRVDIEKHFKHSSLRLAFECQTNRAVVFGPSGSGKSLLLKLIAGFFQPDKGEIIVNGKTFFSSRQNVDLPIHQRQIGYLPQEYTLFPNMTVRENVLYAVKTRKMEIAPSQFQSLMDQFELGSQLDSYPHKLSGGQKQRAALARLLLIKPRLMLLDEPFSALDTPIRESLRELVTEEVDRNGIPSLFVTHDTEEAFIFGKELVIVEQGNVIESGLQEQIFNVPSYVETAKRLGFTNVWPVVEYGDQQVVIDNGIAFSVDGPLNQKAKYVCIRPENVMILREDSGKAAQERANVFSGTLVNVHHRGKYLRLEFKADHALHMNIHVPDYMFLRLNLHEGKEMTVSIRKELVILCDTKTGRK